MQVTETLNDGLKRAYHITVGADELEAKVTAKLAEARPTVEMKGFRKGKVPMALLRKQYGPRLLGEAMQEAVDGAMTQHFETSGDRPAMQPDVQMRNAAWKEGDPVEVNLTYEALPDVPDPDMSALKLTRLVVTPDETAVDEALGSLAGSAKTYETKAGKAETGDQIVVDFAGSVDGEPFEGGAAEDYPLVLGSNSFIPGFEDQLVGAQAGDEVSVNVDFPDDYQAKNLAGKSAMFACTVKDVKAAHPAEIDDALAKRFGADDLDALKTQIRDRLAAEYAQAARAVMKRHLLDQLDAQVSFDLPTSLVDAEAGQIAHQLWHEEHPEVQGHDHPQIETTEEHRALAVRRVRLGLLLAELGRKNEIKVTDAEMTQAVMQQARQYPGQERQFFEYVQKNAPARQQLQAPIFEDKVVDYIFELAEVEKKDVTKVELQAAVAALDEDVTAEA